MSESDTASTHDAATRLQAAIEEYEQARAAVETFGRDRLETLADAHDDLIELLREFEGKATGTGREEFVNTAQVRAAVDEHVEGLDEDVPDRDQFEAAREAIDKRRLSESDFERARDALAPVEADVDRLDRLETASSDLRSAYKAGEEAIEMLEEEIDRLERLLELGEADLDAPIQELREPIETFNEIVETAFEELRTESSTRELFTLLEETDRYPLVDAEQPPAEIRRFVKRQPAGTESLAQLLEYAAYSPSKLGHYVDQPDLLKRRVATQRTALERLDADPFTIDWPPQPADHVPWQARALRGAASQLLDERALSALRELEALARDEERYERLRTAATAAEQLSEQDRERLESGAVERELSEKRTQRERIAELVEEARELLYGD
jgi:hypothetical protein